MNCPFCENVDCVVPAAHISTENLNCLRCGCTWHVSQAFPTLTPAVPRMDRKKLHDRLVYALAKIAAHNLQDASRILANTINSLADPK